MYKSILIKSLNKSVKNIKNNLLMLLLTSKLKDCIYILKWFFFSIIIDLFFKKKSYNNKLTLSLITYFITNNILPKNLYIIFIAENIYKLIGILIKKYRIPYFNLLLLFISSSDILYKKITNSKELLFSYSKWLDHQSMQKNKMWNNLKNIIEKKKEKLKKREIIIDNIFDKNEIKWIFNHYLKKSIPFYLSINLIKSIINFKFQKELFLNTFYSSTFLTLYCYIAVKQLIYTIDKSNIIVRIGLGLSSLGLIFERDKNMRILISKFCLSMSLYNFIKNHIYDNRYYNIIIHYIQYHFKIKSLLSFL